MQAVFENEKIRVMLTTKEDIQNESHIFKLDIKEFDTPV